MSNRTNFGREVDTDRLRMHFSRLAVHGVSLFALASAGGLAFADEDADGKDPSVTYDTIIVTAEKRDESINRVPMSIAAATADQLSDAGITEPRDLIKLTPGFYYADSYVGSPIYTLRGVGFSDISLGGRPTVSIYSDQAPIPFAIETRGASLDLERVEVLKGPQGTLFGQNSTGGAINYVAARPTDAFEAGARIGLGRFSTFDAEAYASGPLTDNLKGRIALSRSQMDDWQESYTTNATNGAKDFTNGRLLLDWEPAANLDVKLAVNGWADKSDVQAGQVIAITPSVPPLAGFIPGLLTYPLAPADAQAADFNPGSDYARDNTYIQTDLRIDRQLSDAFTLTSQSSYSKYSQDQFQDIDGTTLENLSQRTIGDIESYSQELRISGEFNRSNFVAGLNYAKDSVIERGYLRDPEGTVGLIFTPQMISLLDKSDQDITTWAAFASGNLDLSDTVSVYGGVRYTSMKNDFAGCSADAGDGNAAAAFGNFFGALIPVGGCVTLGSTFVPGLVSDKLDEDNVSWRIGLDWTPRDGMMLYANMSEGYKAGSFPSLVATVASQLVPATQESVRAYEAGFKLTLLDRALQLNGAGFYYDYTDKQILGKVVDPIFGPNLGLVNVPESRIQGAELEAVWTPPVEGLRLSAAASYIDSKILGSFVNFDSTGATRDFSGEAFPNTPEWQVVADANYSFGITDTLDGFFGANMTYQGETNSQLGMLPLLDVDAYTLVDLRAGVGAADGHWRLTFWGRNVGDEYYWTTGNPNMDTTVRFAGMPATYGVTLSLKTF